ncbi:MAG: hypothetical protein A2Y65_12165 [Deltaproteobacteria bacterium RBG_13_52_11]|nr:MAG: hypothetical protein A2Y65_12165 [Deltaproteobacteria bacterium RBG_13_52_11]
MKKDLSFYARASQNLIAIHQLRALLTRLPKDGPEILFFRGISLLGDVYPSLGDRGMLDVDILVRGKDLGILKKVLKGMGLEEIEPGVFDKAGLSLDLHASFLNLSRTILEHSCLRISIEDVFRKSVNKQLDDMEIRIPCPEHLFLSTAIHLQSHSFGSQKGWEDLKRIKRYYSLSDEAILTEAKRMSAERALYYLHALRPQIFRAWKGKLSLVERWILKKIKEGTYNQNFGDLLFLFQSKRKVKALKEIFFPHGISFSSIVDRLKKTLLLLRAILLGSKV